MAFDFEVLRPCDWGFCRSNDGGPCTCNDTTREVDVDELSLPERERLRCSGTDEQRALIEEYWGPPSSELFAGQPDRFPELIRA